MRISQSELELCYVNAEIAAMAETKAAAKYPPPHTGGTSLQDKNCVCGAGLAVDETVILLAPPLHPH